MRQLGFLLVLLLVFLLAAGGGAWIFRVDLAQALAVRWLASQGIEAKLTVQAVEPGRIVLRDLALGRLPSATVGHLAIALDWPGADAPRIAALELRDATLRLDLTGGPPLGELEDLLAPQPGLAEAQPGVGLPPTRIDNLTLYAATVLGPAEVRIDGRLAPAEGGMHADATLQGTTPVAVFGGQVEAQGTAQALRRLQVDVRFAAEAQGLDGRLLADLGNLPTAPSGSLLVDLAAGPRAAELLAPLLNRPLGWEGLQLTLDLQGTFPTLAADTAMLAWAEAGDWSAALTLTGQGIDWPGRFGGGEVLLALDASQSGGSLAVLPAQTAEISAGSLDPALLEALALPADLRTQLGTGVRLRLLPVDAGAPLLTLQRGSEGFILDPALRAVLESGPAAAVAGLKAHLTTELNFYPQIIDIYEFNFSLSDWDIGGQKIVSAAASGRFNGPPEELRGALDLQGEIAPRLTGLEIGSTLVSWPLSLTADLAGGRLSGSGPLQATAKTIRQGELRLASLRAALDADVELTREPTSLTLAAPGRLEANDLRLGARRIARLRAQLEENRFDWSSDVGIRHAAAGRWASMALQIAQNGQTLLEADVDPGRWRVEGASPPDAAYAGSFVASQATLDLAAPPLRLEGLQLEAPLPPQPNRTVALAGRLSHTATPPLMPPLELAGTLAPTEAGYALALRGEGLKGALEAELQAQVRPQAPLIDAALRLAPLAFAPGGVQPRDLTPLLAPLEDASGSLAATARLLWGPGGLDSGATVEIENLDFTYDGTLEVGGLAGTLDFDSLRPLRAPPPQILTADRLEAGLVLDDLRADVGVLPSGPDGPPRVQIVAAEAAALGGRLMLREGLIDPAGGRQEARLLVEGIAVQELASLFDAEGVSATGSLSGEIPLVVTDGRITIAGGRLASESEGVLQVTSQAVRETLAAQSRETGLLAQALEDFRYEELSLNLDKPAEGDSTVTLKLLGANPDVLGGQPFDVNVNVTTDLEQILRDLLEVLRFVSGQTDAWNGPR